MHKSRYRLFVMVLLLIFILLTSCNKVDMSEYRSKLKTIQKIANQKYQNNDDITFQIGLMESCLNAYNASNGETVECIEAFDNLFESFKYLNKMNKMVEDRFLPFDNETNVRRLMEMDRLGALCRKKVEKGNFLIKKCFKKSEHFADKHIKEINFLKNKASQFYDQGRYKEVEKLCKKAIEISSRVFGRNSMETQRNKLLLSNFYYKFNQKKYLEKNIELLEDINSAFLSNNISQIHPLFLKAEATLSMSHFILGESNHIAEAKRISDNIWRRIKDEYISNEHYINSFPNTESAITSFTIIGHMFKNLNMFERATKFYNIALSLQSKKYGEINYSNIDIRMNLIDSNIYAGNYGVAEQEIKKSINALEKIIRNEKENHKTLIRRIDILLMHSKLYLYQNQNNKAINELLKAEDIYKRFSDHFSRRIYGDILGNLGQAYNQKGVRERVTVEKNKSFRSAIKYLELSLHINNTQENNLIAISNLGESYMNIGEYNKAEDYMLNFYNECKKQYTNYDPKTLTGCNNLGVLYAKQEKYEKAKYYYKEYLKYASKVVERHHPRFIKTNNNYIDTLIFLRENNEALDELKKLENDIISLSKKTLSTTQAATARNNFLEQISYYHNSVFALSKNESSSNEITKFAANNILNWKYIQIDQEVEIEQYIRNSDKIDKRLKREIQKLRNDVANLYYSTKDNSEVSKIMDELNTKELTLRENIGISNWYGRHNSDIEEVQRKLPKNSALIDFKVYYNWNTDSKKERHFAAYLIKANKKGVLFKDLGNVNSPFNLYKRIEINNKEIGKLSEERGKNKTKILALYKENHNVYKALYADLFNEFEKELIDVTTLYISPDSFLNLIPFACLITPENKFLIEDKEIRIVQTGRELLKKNTIKNYQSSKQEILFIVGFDYNNIPDIGISAKNYNTPFRNIALTDKDIARFNEVKMPCRIWSDSHQTTEENIKNEKYPAYVLFSTHGSVNKSFFEIPLMNCALALTGANIGRNINQKEELLQMGREDGLLYPFEVLGLKLSQTRLVCLNACSTGKGPIDTVEGIYGFARAFKLAGVDSVLVTLRGVGVQESNLFIYSFFNELISNPEMTPNQVLTKVQRDYIDKFPQKAEALYYLSPYVLIN